MADPRLTEGRERLKIALTPVPVVSTLEVLMSRTYSHWNLVDGDLPGWITAALLGRDEVDVGFFASELSGVEQAVLAIDISTIDPLSF